MENKFHRNLNKEKWRSFSKEAQILNIAAEFSRAKNWLAKNDKDAVCDCLKRAFELIDLTISDKKWQKALKELLRFREVLAKFFLEEDKNKDELIKLFRVLLHFNQNTALVRI